MKTIKRKRMRAAAGETAAEFQEELNKALEELADKNPEVLFNMNAGHCAYLMYEEAETIPETASDRFSLMGVRFECRDCPLCAPRQDRRKKWTTCEMTGEFTTIKEPACDKFYEMLERKTIEVRGEHDEV